jgi:D-alanyl-lipoteichoic acid acyltransferase DltB (MBOAT superfamily)
MNWSEIIQQFLYNPDEPLLFNQGFFLFIFALFLICYSFVTSKNKYRQLLIIIFSAYFYYKASGVFLLLLVGTISIDYIFSILIDKQKAVLKRKILLILAITFSLSFLLYFK